jgi:lipoprotein LprG
MAIVAVTAALALTTAACSSKKADTATTTALPSGPTLMQQSETAMSSVQTVHFAIAVEGSLPGLPLSKAQGDLKASGDAKGSANISEFGVNVEVNFIIVNNTFYLKGVTGGYSPMPLSTASSIIDPSAILDPNRGVVQLMKTAKNPTTEAIESVNGHDAYRVAVTPDPAAITSLVPGAGAGTTGKIWIDTTTHRLSKGVFTVPGSGSGKGATVTITMTNYDAPVTVNAP